MRRPWLSALVLGVLSATGFAPLHLWPVALLAMGGIALLAGSADGWKRAAWLGWLFGMGHFTLGNSWIATAFTYQSSMPALLGWAAVPLLSVYLAVYPAIAAGAARAITRGRGGAVLALAFAGCWIIAEWLRSWVFTGYAWNPFGMVLLGPFDRPGLAGLSPWLGTYALSGLAALIGTALLQLLASREWTRSGLVAVLLLVGMYLPVGAEREGSLPVTIVQPDIRQERLAVPSYFASNYQRLADLSVPERNVPARLVLWPESGMTDYLQSGYPERYYARTVLASPEYARNRLARAVGPQSVLLTGAVELDVGPDETGYVRALGAYNAVSAVGAGGRILGTYAKAHLVPYGEYLPMRGLLEPLGLSRLVPGAIDFLPGPGPRTLDLGAWGMAGVQICYEIVFSGQVVDGANRPDYIFNPSNDGWFGAFGPPQHFAQARMRAIEEGLPVLRSTTTGISGIIDARGVVQAYAPMHAMTRIDGMVPPAHSATLFARLGNILPLGWAIILLLAAVVAMRQRRS